MSGSTSDWEVETVDNEALLKAKLSALRTAGTGDVRVMWNSDISKFTIAYLKPA